MVKKGTTLGIFFEESSLEVSKHAFSVFLGCSNRKAWRILDEYIALGYFLISKHGEYSFYKLNRDNLNMKALVGIYWWEKLPGFIEKVNTFCSLTWIILYGDVANLVNDGKFWEQLF